VIKKKHLIYVGDFRFPDGDAGGRRVYGIGLALREAGFDITYAGAEISGREKDLTADDEFAYNGFRYIPAGAPGEGSIRRAWRLFYVHISGISAFSRIKEAMTPATVGIIAYQAFTPTLLRLRRFCKQKGLFLVTDVVEWYDRGHVGGGRFGPFAIDSEIRMRYLHPKTDGIIAISRFLERYYAKSSRAVVRVPPLIDVDEESWRPIVTPSAPEDAIKIAFIGNAGKKDLVSQAIRGLAMLGPDAQKIRLSIVGPSSEEVNSSLGSDAGMVDRLYPVINVLGRMPRSQALQVLAGSDFTFLVRRDARFSQAGFPTKLVESFAMGVPVITNITGDIGLYVRDGIEGIITADSSAAAFADGLRRALKMKAEERAQMRLAARRCAVDSFNYRRWISALDDFFGRFPGNT
jgi:glycosyltransferase involved in cell wall biosynthesis